MRAIGILLLLVGVSHLVYVYGGYLFVLRVLARLRGRTELAIREWAAHEVLPTMTVYIGAKDEEEIINARLENVIDTTYPVDRIEIIVVADGCVDRTEDIARAFMERNHDVRMRIVVEEESKGKWSAQNLAAREGWGDILVSTDAETVFEKETLGLLAAPFSDPTIGVVGGRVVYLSEGDAVGSTYNTYRGVEHEIRLQEMANGILMKSDGPCVAYRREIWQDIEPFEDVDHVVCYFAKCAGFESVYAPDAIAYDRANSGHKQDIKQRSRMTRKFFLTNGKRWNWKLRRTEPGFSWAIYSHRTARLLSPFWLAFSALGALLFLSSFGIQPVIVGSAVAVLGAILLVAMSKTRGLLLAFGAAQLGFAKGVVELLQGDKTGRYTPTRQL